MNQELNTIEIAKLYESQGYHDDAYQIYLKLDQDHSSSQTRAGIDRMEKKVTPDSGYINGVGDVSSGSKKRIARLFEKWINLIVLTHRLDRFKRFKSRLI